MRNTKILEMLENGQVAELKAIIRDEIYRDGIKNSPSALQRHSAMKKYFTYVRSGNPMLSMPCMVSYRGEKYTAFTNGMSLVLTREECGAMEFFNGRGNYLDVEKTMPSDWDRDGVPANLNLPLAIAKSRGYKIKKSEIEEGGDFKYVLHHDGAYFKVGVLDSAYAIINDGTTARVYRPCGRNMYSSMVITNSIGICLILPFKYITEKYGVTVIGLFG